MRITPPGWPPDARPEPEALIKEARRRQRRRWLAAGVAVTVVLAGAAGVAADVAGHPPGRPGPRGHPRSQVAPRQAAAPGPIPRSIGTTLLMWPTDSGQCCEPVAVDDLGTGRLAQRQQPAIGAGDFQPLLAQAGRWLVYVSNGGVTAIRDDLTGRPRVLGPTPFFAPAAAPGRVWLFQVQHGPGVGYDTCKVLRILDVVTGKLISFRAPRAPRGGCPAVSTWSARSLTATR